MYAEPKPVSEKELARVNSDLDDTSDRASRQEAAVALRLEGAPFSEIARVLEYSSATQARQAVERCLASLANSPESKDQVRFLESRRLERILRGLWRKATQEEFVDPVTGEKTPNDEHLAAARTALAVIDRHARLHGVDAPQEMIVHNPTQIELQKWVEQVAANVRSAGPKEVDIIEGTVIGDSDVGDDE